MKVILWVLLILLWGCAYRDTLPFEGYRTLKNGTKLVIVGGWYCPQSAVTLTPSVVEGDYVEAAIDQCSTTIAQWDNDIGS